MVKSLKGISLLDILPPNLLEDKKIYAAAKALDVELKEISEDIKLALYLPRLNELPDEVLDSLAWQYHVDFYEPDLDIEVKRNLIRQSYYWHRIKGTPLAVKMLLENIFEEVKLEEWFNYPEGEGKPYRFRVKVGGFKKEVSKEYILRMIEAGKNLRSHLDYLEIDLTEKEKQGDEWIYPERNILMHYFALVNSFNNWRNVPFENVEDNDLNILLHVLTGQSGVIDVAADYTIKDGILLPKAAILPTQSAIREIAAEHQPLPSWITEILAPSYSVIKAATKTSSLKTITISLALPDDGKINFHQGHALISSKVKTLNIETPQDTALYHFTGFFERFNAYREIEAKLERLPAEITDIIKPSYNQLYASLRDSKKSLKYLYLPTIDSALNGFYAAIRTFQNAKREIPLSLENLPKWLFDFNYNQAVILTGTKVKRQTSKVLKLDTPDDLQTKLTTAAIIADNGRRRIIKLDTPANGDSKLFTATKQVNSSNNTIQADSEQVRKILHDLTGDALGDTSTNLFVAVRDKNSRCITINADHAPNESSIKTTAALWNSREKITSIDADGEQLKELFKAEGLDKAAIVPTFTLAETSTRHLTIKPDYNTSNHLQATTAFWNSRSRHVEIESAQQDTLPKEITDIKSPANISLNMNSRIKRQNTKVFKNEAPTGGMATSTVFLFANKTKCRVIKTSGIEEVGNNAKVTLWNQKSRYIEIGLDLEQLERLMSRRKSKVLPHVGLMHVGAMAVQ